MRFLIAVAIGAAVGGLARYYLANLMQARAGADFPSGTLLINITGSLLLGLIMRFSIGTGAVSDEIRVLLAVGFCGGYTTFSSFSYETVMLLTDRAYARAATYIALSVGGSLAGTILGVLAANRIISIRGGP